MVDLASPGRLKMMQLPGLMRLFAWLPDADPTKPGKRPWGGVVRYARLDGGTRPA